MKGQRCPACKRYTFHPAYRDDGRLGRRCSQCHLTEWVSDEVVMLGKIYAGVLRDRIMEPGPFERYGRDIVKRVDKFLS